MTEWILALTILACDPPPRDEGYCLLPPHEWVMAGEYRTRDECERVGRQFERFYLRHRYIVEWRCHR